LLRRARADAIPKVGALDMKTVLIVDDHQDCAEPLARMLGHCGYRALIAEGGRQAIGFMNTIVPDMVLLDVMLPGMNGVEFLEAVNCYPRFAKLPVVAYTVMSDVETHRRLIELGVRRVLQKGTDSFGDVLESVKLAIGEPRDEGDENREGRPPTAA
jgi:CheY-like chemotaxis protein